MLLAMLFRLSLLSVTVALGFGKFSLVAGEANKIETRSVTRFESLPNPRATVTLSSESLKSMASSI